MSDAFKVIEIHTSEEARHGGKPLARALVERVAALGAGARCAVFKGVAGAYENGETATGGVEVLSFDLPVKVEIVLPAAALPAVLPLVEAMATEGVVLVGDRTGVARRKAGHLLPKGLRVRDVMSREVRAVREEAPLREAVDLLIGARFKGVPVVDAAGRPVGMITPWNLVARGGLPMRPALLATMEPERVRAFLDTLPPRTAGEVMTPGAVTTGEGETLEAAVTTMAAQGLKRLPVVDAGGRLVGMLSRIDVFRAVVAAPPAGEPPVEGAVPASPRVVADVMRHDVPTVSPDTPLETVIRLVAAPGSQRVAVTDAEGRLVGLVSDRILLDSLAEHRAGIWDLLTGGFSFPALKRNRDLLRGVRSRTAADVMLADPVAVTESTPLEEAARIMTEKRLKRLPVVDGGGRFRGMVGRDYLLRSWVGAGAPPA